MDSKKSFAIFVSGIALLTAIIFSIYAGGKIKQLHTDAGAVPDAGETISLPDEIDTVFDSEEDEEQEIDTSEENPFSKPTSYNLISKEEFETFYDVLSQKGSTLEEALAQEERKDYTILSKKINSEYTNECTFIFEQKTDVGNIYLTFTLYTTSNWIKDYNVFFDCDVSNRYFFGTAIYNADTKELEAYDIEEMNSKGYLIPTEEVCYYVQSAFNILLEEVEKTVQNSDVDLQLFH